MTPPLLVDDAPSLGHLLTEMYAWVAADAEGEGIVSALMGDQHYPLIAGDTKRLEDLRPYAQLIARETGRTLRLIRFTTRETIETLNP